MRYRIQSGDTLSAIASRSRVSLSALLRANPDIKNPNLIYAGRSLNLPGASDSFEPARSTARSAAVPASVGGRVGQWIAQAQRILQAAGIPLSKMNAQDLATIIQRESSGNPNAQNNWDSNAAKGHPSIGLMQTIGPTFNAYKLPGHGNIRDPIDNIIAGVRYAVARYGSVSNVPGIVNLRRGRAYVGY